MADFMAVYGSPLLDAAAIVQVVMISEQLLMISAGSFCNKWKYFLSIVGCGAGGHELRFRRLKPLTWVFGKKGGHDAYGYVCLATGGGGIGVGHRGAAAVAKENALCAKDGGAMLRWLLHS